MDAAASARDGAGRAGSPCEPATACGRAALLGFVSSVSFRLRRLGRENCGEMAGRAYGKTLWSWPSLLRSSCRGGVCEPNRADSIIQIREAREAKRKVRLPGEHGISRPTIAQGRPSDWLHLYAAVRFFCATSSRSGPRVPAGTRPSLRPLGFEGGVTKQSSGETRREDAKACLQSECELEECRCRLMLRHCERSEAIQSAAAKVFWIASAFAKASRTSRCARNDDVERVWAS